MPELPEMGRPLIVLTLEGLATASLGCYGSSWNVTPAIDRIASEGCVWDRLIATDDDPLLIFKQWCSDSAWPERFRAIGSIELLTDDVRLASDEIEEVFDIVEVIDPHQMPGVSGAAESFEQTQLAQLILMAIERCRDPEPFGVLWLHSRFLSARWDAPRDLIPLDDAEDELLVPSEEPELLGEEGDQQSPASAVDVPFMYDQIEPPRIKMDDDTHPDVVTSWMRTYACQIRLVDDLLDVWMQSAQDREPHLVIAGTSGFGLGQNGWIGHRAGPLRSSDIRLPVVVRKGDGYSSASSLRVPQLTRSTSLAAVLSELNVPSASLVSPADWCRLDDEFQPSIVTESARSRIAVTTPRWFCVDDAADANLRGNEESSVDPSVEDIPSVEDMADGRVRLFLKPDDVEDVNDVGRLRIDVVDQLVSIAQQGRQD